MKYKAVVFLVFIVSILIHFSFLTSIPRGYHDDEMAITNTAYTLATTGKDMIGRFLPLFPVSYDSRDMQSESSIYTINPLYTYTQALLIKLFGVHEVFIRGLSACFFLIFQIGLFLFLQVLFKKERQLPIVGLIISTFLPFFFLPSRVGYEVISILPLLSFGLFFLTLSLEKTNQSKYHAFIAGCLFASTFYAYSTARLMAILWFTIAQYMYFATKQKQKSLHYFLGFFLTALPFVYVFFFAGNDVIGRFIHISYFSQSNASIWTNIQTFLATFISYFSPFFTLTHGDTNLRHHVGNGGVLGIALVILLFLSAPKYKQLISSSDSILWIGLTSFVISAPIAAALIEPFHLLRSIHLGLFLIPFFCLGFKEIQKLKVSTNWIVTQIPLLLLCCYITEQICMLQTFFIVYQNISIMAFRNQPLYESVQTLSSQSKDLQTISIDQKFPNPYTEAQFLSLLFKKKITVNTKDQNNQCSIFMKDIHNYPELPKFDYLIYATKTVCEERNG